MCDDYLRCFRCNELVIASYTFVLWMMIREKLSSAAFRWLRAKMGISRRVTVAPEKLWRVTSRALN